ncbi:MAG: hypothetical protein ACJA0U_002935 [Salibacteraceae bacterium]|jgi:hypothetical protein
MKKYLILALAIIALGAVSCKKCQTCTTVVSQNVQGFETQTSASEEYCGDAYDDAPAPTNFTQNVGGISQSVTITCVEN